VKEGTDDEESVTPRWQLEASRHHALDCEILVERLPTQRCATDLQPNLGQLRLTGISQTVEPIRGKSHDPLIRQFDEDHPALSPRSRRYGFGFVMRRSHRTLCRDATGMENFACIEAADVLRLERHNAHGLAVASNKLDLVGCVTARRCTKVIAFTGMDDEAIKKAFEEAASLDRRKAQGRL
jgi:hypothetical protein